MKQMTSPVFDVFPFLLNYFYNSSISLTLKAWVWSIAAPLVRYSWIIVVAVSQFYSDMILIADPRSKLPGKIKIVSIIFKIPLPTHLYTKCYQLVKFTQCNCTFQKNLAGFNLWCFIHSKMVHDGWHYTQNRRLNSRLNMMINNTIRKLPSSIIFDARSGGYSI